MFAYKWDENKIRWKITSAQGWAYYAWAKENEMTMWGAKFERKSPGYIQQEAIKIKEQWLTQMKSQ